MLNWVAKKPHIAARKFAKYENAMPLISDSYSARIYAQPQHIDDCSIQIC